MVIESWLKKHTNLYVGATRHPFILAIRDGQVDLSAFKRWLGQDYLFVRAFVAFAASVLVKASKQSDADASSDVDAILAGLASLSDEIAWFKKEASKWNVDLANVIPQKANREYCGFLESHMEPDVPYAVAVTAFWAIEAVYQESFAHCLEGGGESKVAPELRETCERWGNDGFGEYCRALKGIAERELSKAAEDVRVKAEVVFLSVVEREVDFWNMSTGEGEG